MLNSSFIGLYKKSRRSVWDPTNLAALTGWYDGDNPNNTSATWVDSSGNGNNATTIGSATLESGGYYEFISDGGFDTGLSIDSQSFFVMFVGRVASLLRSAMVGQASNNRNGASAVDWEIGSVGGSSPSFAFISFDGSGGNPSPVTINPVEIDTDYIFGGGFDASQVYGVGNGVEDARVKNVGVASRFNTYLGGIGAFSLDGRLYDVVILSEYPSEADRQKIEGYLAHKRGLLESLPFDHPYRWDGREFGYSQLWTPAELSPEAWFDAQDASTVTEAGSGVSVWSNKGAGGNATQSNDSDRPGYQSLGISGQPSIYFDGSGQRIDFSLSGFSNSGSAFVIFQPDFDNEYSLLTSNGDDWTRFSNSGNYSILFRSNRLTNVAVGQFATSGAQIAGWVADSEEPTYSILRNGVEIYSDTNSFTFDNVPDTVSAGAPTNGFLKGWVAEIIVTTQAVSQDEIDKVFGYFAHKYGLTSVLASDHPYKTAAPTV